VRLLVLDASRILTYLVRHETPAEVEVEEAVSLEEAERLVREHPPDAAVVSLPPAHLPWRSFQHLCASRRPPVPVLYESCVHTCAVEAGLDPQDGYAVFLPKPARPAELRGALAELVAAARRAKTDRPSRA
jgi:DNA-binding response OmpR family regulator